MNIFKSPGDKATVVSEDQVVTPVVSTDGTQSHERYLRPLEKKDQLSVQNTHPGAVRRK